MSELPRKKRWVMTVNVEVAIEADDKETAEQLAFKATFAPTVDDKKGQVAILAQAGDAVAVSGVNLIEDFDDWADDIAHGGDGIEHKYGPH